MQHQYSWLEPALAKLKIASLNDMQQAAWEALDTHDHLVLLSATGSGKTLGFLLPLVPALLEQPNKTTALVVAPTRELALQIESVFKSLQLGLKITCCYGGHKREIEENNLVDAPAIIVGTPGRLGDHIRRENIDTSAISSLVLDEFDKSLELGFQEEMAFLKSSLPALKKIMLTSATNSELPEFLDMPNPQVLNFLDATQPGEEALKIQVLKTASDNKQESLFQLICHLGNRSTVVFCNHRDAVEDTHTFLKEKGIVSVYYHGALEQRDREISLAKFRNGTSNVLVTTDLASRGLDIFNIRYIIHYHLPGTEAIFTHRNGRTARMDASGTAILMIGAGEYQPPYLPADTEQLVLPFQTTIPDKPKWTTLYIAAGKKTRLTKLTL